VLLQTESTGLSANASHNFSEIKKYEFQNPFDPRGFGKKNVKNKNYKCEI
jgi:hypothetical protein